ncbi:MAG: PAS domain S-box protein, partial [Bryobacteraceae bacterium]
MVPAEREECRESVTRKLAGEKPLAPGQRDYVDGNGRRLFLEFHENLIHDGAGRIAGIRTILLNVTERRRAEDAVRASEARYRSLFENVLEGVYQSTGDGKLLTVNPALVKMFGYSSEEEFLQIDIGRNLYADPEQRDAAIFILERDGELRNFQLLLHSKDGREVIVLENSRAVRGEDGSVKYYEGTLTDVTDLVRAQDELAEERDFTGAVIDTAAALIIVSDPYGNIVRFNRACEQVSGYTFAEVHRRSMWDLFILPGEARALHDKMDQVCEGAAAVRFENHWRTKDGGTRLIAWSNATLRDKNGQTAFIISTGIDVTEHRRAEEALRASEQRYRELVESANDIVYTHDLTGNLTSANGAAERVLGYPIEEALKMNIAQIVAPENLEYARAKIREKLGTDRPTTYELAVLAKGGYRLYLEVSTRIQYQDGKPVGVFGIARDVTERKMAEAKVESYARELTHKNEELAAALAAAREATELKSRFLATMSHEIRTPMNGVLGMTELLIGTQLDAEQRDYAQAVKHSAEALLNVINDILDISKIEAGKLTLERVRFDVRRVVEEVIELLGPRANAKNLELLCRLSPSLPRTLLGDPGRLRQVLLNLVGNAVKFTERGEVEVRAEVATAGAGAVTLSFAVRDTGIGISREQHPRLFESFVQVDGSTTR